MRACLLPIGSRGDVQPMLALANALRARGHEVVIGAPENNRAWIGAAGVPFQSVGVDMAALFGSLKLQRMSKLRAFREMRPILTGAAEAEVVQSVEAAAGADIVVGAGAVLGAIHAAERHGKPYVAAFYSPVWVPSLAHPPLFFPFHGLPAWGNRVLWWVARAQLEGMIKKPINRGRVRAGLPAIDALLPLGPRLALAAWDPILGPPPDDAARALPGWPVVEIVQVGALPFTHAEPLAPALASFLDACDARGAAPIYVGFGSMTDSDPHKTAALIRAAAESHGVHVVWCTGWTAAETGDVGDRVFVTPNAPHPALLPRCRAIVHHGGAGTTAAALRAGRPQLVVPHVADQFFTGRKLHALGLGPAPIPRPKLSAARLGAAIADLFAREAEYAAAARAASSALPPDPLGAAARQLEAWAAAPP